MRLSYNPARLFLVTLLILLWAGVLLADEEVVVFDSSGSQILFRAKVVKGESYKLNAGDLSEDEVFLASKDSSDRVSSLKKDGEDLVFSNVLSGTYLLGGSELCSPNCPLIDIDSMEDIVKNTSAEFKIALPELIQEEVEDKVEVGLKEFGLVAGVEVSDTSAIQEPGFEKSLVEEEIATPLKNELQGLSAR